MKMIVTSYPNPDLDGTACAIAYAELLRAQGEDARAAVVGLPDKEAQAALAFWKIDPPLDDEAFASAAAIVLVDASNLGDFPSEFNPHAVIEIIDHRQLHEAHAFPNAKVHIDLVGAAATLVAERFRSAGVQPAQSTAGALVGAIASNNDTPPHNEHHCSRPRGV